MKSIAPLLLFDTHDANGDLRMPDAASAALHEIANKLGYAKLADPCAGSPRRPIDP